MEKYLKFIGTGGAFSKNNTNNSAYYIIKDKMVLFDCGETVFHEIITKNIIDEKIKRIDIIITHFHSDHVGSLGSLVFYCKYKKMEDINIIFPQKELPKTLLNLFGISDKIYHIKLPKDIDDYYLKEYEQLHGCVDENGKIIKMPAYGYHFKYNKDSFYYSGDTCTMPDEILHKFKSKEIDVMYHEVNTDGYKTHFQLEDLIKIIPEKERSRVYCMHMGDKVNQNVIKNKGFRSVR